MQAYTLQLELLSNLKQWLPFKLGAIRVQIITLLFIQLNFSHYDDTPSVFLSTPLLTFTMD